MKALGLKETFLYEEGTVEQFVDELFWWFDNIHHELKAKLEAGDVANKTYFDSVHDLVEEDFVPG